MRNQALLALICSTAVQALHDWDSSDHWYEPHHALGLWFVVGFIVLVAIFIGAVLLCGVDGRHHPFNRDHYAHYELESGHHQHHRSKKHGKKHSDHYSTPRATVWTNGQMVCAGVPLFAPPLAT